jgi:hypothetical protein
MFGHETAEETRAAEQAAHKALNAEVLAGAWIVTTHHEHCAECNAQIDNAVAHAKVTGSVGATYNVQQPDGTEHGAKVERETHAQRREALGES